MEYQIKLIRALKSHAITRADFCARYAAAQGYDAKLKIYANNNGTFATYRKRTAKIENGLLLWKENGRWNAARTFKEMKIRIDIEEIKAAA